MTILPCLRCGHEALVHAVKDQDAYMTHDGAMVDQYTLGGCLHIDEELQLECPCDLWDPDRLPRVTELLGLDVRSIVP